MSDDSYGFGLVVDLASSSDLPVDRRNWNDSVRADYLHDAHRIALACR